MGTITVNIVNNGSANYQVGYRIAGSGSNFTGYTSYAAQEGLTTVVTIENLPDNTYEVDIKSMCEEGNSVGYQAQTEPCASPTVFNVTQDEDNFIVNYAFPSGVEDFNVRVGNPGGGFSSVTYPVEVSGVLNIPKPDGQTGVFTFKMRSVCNTDTGWASPYSNTIGISVGSTSSCPVVQSSSVQDISNGSVRVNVTPPDDDSLVDFYSIILTPAVGSPLTFNMSPGEVFKVCTGLAANTYYDITVKTNCIGGGSATTSGGSFTTDNTSYNFRATSSMGGAQGTDFTISGSPFFAYVTGALPLNSGGVIEGIHGGFTGAIVVVITGAAAANSKVTLRKNGTLLECINVGIGTAGTKTFGSQTFLSTDLCEMCLCLGSC